jgi:peptide/nickel transport system substrate-binding protein
VYGVGIIHPDSPFAVSQEVLRTIPGFDLDDPEANKEKARQALANAGFQPGELTLNMPTWANVIEPFVPCLAEDFNAVGITLNPTVTETARMYDLLTAAQFDMAPWSFFLTGFDPDITLYEHFYTGSDRNYGRFSDPEIDRLIDEQSATLDPEERKGKIRNLSEILMREQAKLVLHWTEYLPITGPKVRNFLPGPTCTSHGPCFRYEQLWLEE